MAQGLKQGLEADIDGFAAAAAALVNTAEAAARNAAGAESPSRLFASLGADLGAGLKLGLIGSYGEIHKASAQMVDVGGRALLRRSHGAAGAAGSSSSDGAAGSSSSDGDLLRTVLDRLSRASTQFDIAIDGYHIARSQRAHQGKNSILLSGRRR